MKKLLVTIIAVGSVLIMQGQGQWAWLTGNPANNSPAVYGTQGVPSTANWPKAIYAGCEWNGANGDLWFYSGNNGMTDLWKYDPVALTWTWMKGPGTTGQPRVYGTMGVPAAANTPGSRVQEIPTWTDQNGDLWLFGGDMWRYSVATNMWTWMSGPQNTSAVNYGTQKVFSAAANPGTRTEASCAWVDNNGDFWMFGGNQGGRRNDLWKYDPTINQWAWWSGTTTANHAGSYGTKGVPAATNIPSGRYAYLNWYDSFNNRLYLYGGFGNGGNNPLSDMWMYDIGTDMWTWVSGSSGIMDPGQYGTQCVPDVNNYPCSRFENKQEWVDECGNFWLFGGFTYLTGTGQLNDLWRFNPNTLEWTWVKGSQLKNTNATFGTQGVPAPANEPPSSFGTAGWQDADGQFYMYGGPTTYNSIMWKYYPDPPTAQFNYTIGSLCGEVHFRDTSAITCNYIRQYRWDFGDGDTSWVQHPTHVYQSVGNYNVQLIVRSCTGQEDTATVLVNVTGNNVYDTTNVTICQGQSYFAGGANQTTTGQYNDTLLASTGCDSIITTNLTVTGVINHAVNPTICQGQTYFAQGANQTTSGIYTDTLTSVGGCDSVITTNLTVTPSSVSTANPVICQGQSYFAGGANQTATGTYYDTLTAASGCDSVVTTNLTVTPSVALTLNPNICQGQSYWAGGANQSTSGTYVDSLTTSAGCDSVVTTNLTVLPVSVSNTSVSVCQGQTAVIHGTAQSIAGIYVDTLQNAVGCDSVSNVTLVVNPIHSANIDFTLCEDDSVQINGTYYTSAQNFSINYSSSAGCDSTITYDIVQIARPIVDLGPNIEECDGNTVSLAIGPMPEGFESTWWNGSQEPVQVVTNSGNYWITVTHPLCYNIQDTVTVEFKDCNFYIYVPNAFTPNGDPFNPNFRAKAYGELEEFEMFIFDRWGELLFTAEDINTGWDGTYKGKPAKTDTYVWKINYKSKYEEKKSIIGKVTLLR